MARPSKAKAPSIETQSSTSTVVDSSMGEIIIPKTRRKKTSAVDKPKAPLGSTDMCSSPTAILGTDANKENESHRSKSSQTKSLCKTYFESLNEKAGNPITMSIQIISLAQCSSYLPSTMTQDSHTAHIKEKKIEIINIARHCLQDVSLKDLESTIDFQTANLSVAVHCLRSVNTTLLSIHASGDTKIHAAVDRSAQLYFHSISIAENMAVECFKASQKQDDEFTSFSSMYTAVHMCLGAYEGLGHLLKSIWNLPWMRSSHGSPPILSLFPVPDLSLIRRNKDTLQQCTKPLTLSDFKNVFRSITSLCTALTTLKRAAFKAEPSGSTREFLTTHSETCRPLQADCFGEKYLINLFDSDPTSTSPFQIIISEVLMPWMMAALCFDDFFEAEALKEVSNYCNRGYSILLGAAQDIDRSPCKDNFRKYRLKLHEDALVLLLFHQHSGKSTFPESNVISLRLKSLDQVCKLASDSSSVYFQSGQRQADDELIRFHLNVGGAIDDVVLESKSINNVYIDYCARRAFHLSRSSSVISFASKRCSRCIFAQLPFPFSHTKDDCVYHGAANHRVKSLALLYITLCLTENLLDSTIEQIAETFLSDYLSMVDALGGFAAMSLTDLLDIFMLTKILQLTGGPPQRFTNIEPYHLGVLASIFSKIFIPVVLALFNQSSTVIIDSLKSPSAITPIHLSERMKFSSLSSIEKAEREEMLAKGINLLLKTVYILEKLENFILSDKCIVMIVDWLLTESMITADVGIKLIDFSAKTLYHVGKMRMRPEAGVACIMPVIANVELLALSFSSTRKIDYKISDRYDHLSKLFLSHNMIREATAATALSIKYLVYELSLITDPSASDMKESEILLCIDENSVRQCPISFSSDWPESFSSRCRALLCKLANLLKGDLSTSMYFKSHFAGSVTISTWPNMKVLYDICGDGNSSPVKNIICNAFLGDKAQSEKRMFRLLSQVTKIFIWEFIRTCDCCDKYEVAIVQDAVDAVITLFDDHGDQVSCIELNAIAAIALSTDDKSISYTKSFLSEALRRCQGAQDLGLISEVYYARLYFFYLHVLSFDQDPNEKEQHRDLPILTSALPSKGYDEIVQICSDCLLKLAQDDPSSNEMMINSLISLLTKSYLMLDYEGCSVRYLSLDLQMLPSYWENRLNLSILRYSHAINLLGGEKYHELGALFDEMQLGKSFSDVAHTMQQDSDRLVSLMRHGNFDEYSAQLCSDIFTHALRLEICVNLSDIEELSHHVQYIDSLVCQLSDYDTGAGRRAQNSFIFIVQFVHELWIMSCYIFLYGYYDRIGHVLMSMKYLCQYRYHSQKILKSLEQWLRCKDRPGQHQHLISLYQICCSHTFTFHLSARISDCYMRLSTLYAQLGDTHKSMRYSLSSAETLGVSSSNMKINRRTSIVELFDGFSYNSRMTYRQRRSVRSFFNSLLLALPFASADEYILDLSKTKLRVICDETEEVSAIDTDWMREAVKDLVILGDSFVRNKRITVDTEIFFDRALSFSLRNKKPLSIINLDENLLLQVAHPRWSSTFWDVIARVGQRLHQLDEGSTERCLCLLRGVVSATVASSLTRALALYHLGLHFLHLARASGELYRLWEGHCNRGRSFSSHHISSSQGNIFLARDYFGQGSFLAGPTSSPLSRKIMRCLALVTGPKLSRILGYSASELLHSSIGCTARIQASRLPFLSDLFTALDVPLNEEACRQEAFQQLYAIGSKTLPSTWNFVAISLCPSGEVLISSIRPSLSADSARAFVSDIVCIFPPSEDEDLFSVVDDVLVPFNNLMERSNVHLSGSKGDMNPMGANYSSAKEIWWTERRSLDTELKSLLTVMDDQLFNHACVKEVVSPYGLFEESYVEDDLRHVSGNLSMKFEAMCTVGESDAVKRSCYKPEEPNSDMSSDPPISSSLRTGSTVFLVLDEYFQSLPMENLPTFIDSTVCRIPSIPFAIARCHNQSSENHHIPSIDLQKTTYALDPESNLAETRARMHEFFDNLSLNYGWTWNGFIGEIPSDDAIEAALRRDHSLYLFCGHGGGESILPRKKFDHFFLDSGKDKGAEYSPCQSALVLMGCSSGRLVSVNAAEDEFAPYGEYHYEPDGAIISYLCAGAPCVVGNLWDVTDRDIDRYFKDLLSLFAAGDNDASDGDQSMNLAECVARARSACKLRYIVGGAPVIYGVPPLCKSYSN